MGDPAQDQDFLNAPQAEQHAYLMASDKDYASAKPEEQTAYLRSVNNPNPEAMLAKSHQQASADLAAPIKNAPLPHEEVGAYHNAETVGHGNVPAGREAIGKSGEKVSTAMGIAAPAMASVAMPLASGATIPGALRVATTAGLGAMGGRYAGGGIGGMFGETGKHIGEGVGSLLGGLAGGVEGYNMRPPNPQEELGAFMNKGYKSMIPPPEEAGPELGSPENPGFHSKLPTTMPKVAPPIDPLKQAIQEGRAARIPARMPAPTQIPPSTPELGSPENPGWTAKLPDRMPERTAPLGSPENPGFHSKLPTRMPEPAQTAAPASELGSPDNPGWHAPLPTRMPKTLQVATPEPAPELGSPENPGFHAKLPTRMPRTPATPAAPTIYKPTDTGGEPRFTGSEGRPATWTNDDVIRLAKTGNREAIQQAVRRGIKLPENARYVMGDPDYSRGTYNPRETTTGPDNEPIRNKQNPRRP